MKLEFACLRIVQYHPTMFSPASPNDVPQRYVPRGRMYKPGMLNPKTGKGVPFEDNMPMQRALDLMLSFNTAAMATGHSFGCCIWAVIVQPEHAHLIDKHIGQLCESYLAAVDENNECHMDETSEAAHAETTAQMAKEEKGWLTKFSVN